MKTIRSFLRHSNSLRAIGKALPQNSSPLHLRVCAATQQPTTVVRGHGVYKSLHTAPSRLKQQQQQGKPPPTPPPTSFSELDVLGNTPVPSTSVDVCMYDGFELNSGVTISGGWGAAREWGGVCVAALGDLLVIGVGKQNMPLSPQTRKYISELGMRVEVLDTRNAAAQFNLLATERGCRMDISWPGQPSLEPTPEDPLATDPHTTDPALLRDYSEFKAYKTSRFEYPKLRVFFRQHVKAEQLPRTPAPLPLIVCIPGLGGSVAQFYPLMRSLVDLAPCLAVDWPGGGRSQFAPTEWEAYTSEALMELLEVIIDDYRDKEAGQSVVLIGHSMGTALSAGLASKKIPHKTALAEHVAGLVAICPVSGPMPEATVTMIKRLFWIPAWIFVLWRAWDGIGGPNSASVSRFVGEGAQPELKLMQHRFNQQSLTPVWRRMAYGALPTKYEDGKPVGGMPGLDVWADLDIPVYLIAGESDKVTLPKEVDKILEAMNSGGGDVPDSGATEERNGGLNLDSAAPVNVSAKPQDHIPDPIYDAGERLEESTSTLSDYPETNTSKPSTPVEGALELPPQPPHPPRVIKSIVLPAPANHTLLYMPRCVRVLAGLVSDFLACNITQRLSLAWQLQHLSREGKWDVKNLIKWQGVNSVSEAIGPKDAPVFRVTKTLREVDEVHCPKMLVENWGHVIKDLIDLSKDQPVYDPRGLERGGIHYHKFPTMSKVPPEGYQVDEFIKLVDSIREVQRERAVAEGWDDPSQVVVGVHCHYGYNRSGYFIVCYLVERCGYALQDAIEEFALAKPNGIRHSHFLDKLYMRYNLERA
ncbi:mRNA-capping enzyme [Cladobotryum mycophilum]|uniref:mRNA-capping enzyme n=1 Tax=Cladobotryum mycophilum TaxID=491253 RepID=A0ABR0SRN6_9HYPO